MEVKYLGDLFQGLLSSFLVLADDEGLVLNDCQIEGVASDTKTLVYQVDLGFLGQVAQEIHGSVQVVHHCHFTPDAVVQPPGTVVVDEAVSHPHGCTANTPLLSTGQSQPRDPESGVSQEKVSEMAAHWRAFTGLP